MEFITQIKARHRPQVILQPDDHPSLMPRQPPQSDVVNARAMPFDTKRLGGADSSGVLIASGTALYRQLEIGIIEYNKRSGATQFQYRTFSAPPPASERANRRAGARYRHRHRRDSRIAR